MSLLLAIKSFFKALKNPEEAQTFLEEKKALSQDSGDVSHLRLLALLQQTARFVDFFKEDISSFDDAQVGAAVRKIHQDCSKTLEEFVTIRPIMEEQEGAKINIPKGYDPLKIKVVGNVKGEPPYAGTLVHKGWKVHKRSLPKQTIELSSEILQPAEIEIR